MSQSEVSDIRGRLALSAKCKLGSVLQLDDACYKMTGMGLPVGIGWEVLENKYVLRDY